MIKRPFAIIGASYIISLLILNLIPNIFSLIPIFLTFILLLILLIIKKSRSKKSLLLCLITCFLASIVNFINFKLNIEYIKNLSETEVKISGIIYDIPYKKYDNYIYTLKIQSVNNKEIKPFKIILYSKSPIDADLYDKITCNVNLNILKSNNWITDNWYNYSQGIYASAYSYRYNQQSTEKNENFSLRYYTLEMRKRIILTTKEIFPSEIANVINGFILSYKNDIPQTTKETFQKSGIYHILATSGIHVAIFSEFLIWIFKKLKMSQKISTIFSCIGILSFMAITCFTPSASKSGIMMIIYLIGNTFFRKPDNLNSLGLAVFLICLFNPNSAMSISLWLSFLSTLGIIFLYEPIKNFLYKKFNNNKSNLFKYIVSDISISISTALFTFPVTGLIFKQFSVISPITNILILFPANLFINLSLTINFLYNLNFSKVIISALYYIISILYNFIINIAKLFSDFPFATISTNYGVFKLYISFVLILVAISLSYKNVKKSIKITILLSINLALGGCLSYQFLKSDDMVLSIVPCKNGFCGIISLYDKNSAILNINGETQVNNIVNFLSGQQKVKSEYLNLMYSDEIFNDETLDCIMKAFNPKLLSYSGKLNLNYSDTKLIKFKNQINSNLWDCCKIKTIKEDKYTYTSLNLYSTKVLIFENGGDIEDLPKSWLKCDIVIFKGLPMNYNHIKFKSAILLTSKFDLKIIWPKIKSNSSKIIPIVSEKPMYISSSKNNNTYQIKGAL